MQHPRSSLAFLAFAGLGLVSTPAQAADPKDLLRTKIQYITSADKCAKAEENLAKLLDKGVFEAQLQAKAEDMIVRCWYEARDWPQVAAYGLPALDHSSSGWPQSESNAGNRIRMYAVLAHTDIDPVHVLVERLGTAKDGPGKGRMLGPTPGMDTRRPNDRLYFEPGRSSMGSGKIGWPVERYQALADTDVGWLRAGVAACLDTLGQATSRVGRGGIDGCVGQIISPEAALAAERALAAEAKAKAQAARAAQEAQRQATLDAEVASGACVEAHLRAMQGQVEFLSGHHQSGSLLEHEIFLLDGAHTQAFRVLMPGPYRVWAFGVDKLGLEVHNPKGQSQPTDPGVISVVQGSHTAGARFVGNTGETFTIQLQGRGCSALAILMQ